MANDDFDELAGGGEEERLHPILSNEEFLAAKEKARKRIEAERKTAAMKAVEAQEVERLKLEDGFTSGSSDLDEIVDVTIDVPPWCAISGAATGIVVNRQPYHHGHTYAVPRHVAHSLRENMFNAWKVDAQVDGKGMIEQYARKRNTVINARSGAINNAPSRFDA